MNLKIVEMVDGKEVILGIICTPDAEERAKFRAEQHRKEGKIVQVLPYDGPPRKHF